MADLSQIMALLKQSQGPRRSNQLVARAPRSASSAFATKGGHKPEDSDNTLWSILGKAITGAGGRSAPDTYVPQTRSGLVMGDIGRAVGQMRDSGALPSRLSQESSALDRLRQVMDASRGAGKMSRGAGNLAQSGGLSGLSAMMQSMRGGSNGSQGMMGGLGGSYIDSLLEQMAMGGGGQMPDMPDAAQMAEDQFAPQFDLLNNQRTQTTDRYNQAGADTRAMYDALADQIRQEAINTEGAYDRTGGKMRDTYDNAISNVEGSASRSNNEIAEIMSRLGVQAAAPDALENIAVERQRGVNNLAGNSQAFEQANTQFGQNMSDYQNNTANTTGVAGANAQADWTKRLGEALGGFDNQELQLTGQQKQAENQYLMQLQQMMGEYQTGMAGNQMDALQMAIGRENDMWGRQGDMFDQQMAQNRFGLDQYSAESQRQNNQAQREMDLARFGAEQQQAAYERNQQPEQDWGVNTPGQVMHHATQIFGGNAANAQSGVREVQRAFLESDGSVQSAMQALTKRHATSPYLNQYLALAEIYANANRR